jgi:hypothetical protein
VSGTSFVLTDTRFNRRSSRRELAAAELALLLACDAPSLRQTTVRRADAVLKGQGCESSRESLEGCLSTLIQRDEIADVSGRLVTLVVLPSSVRERARTWEHGPADAVSTLRGVEEGSM